MLTREIQRALDELLVGNVILYPTDTVWGIGCDAENVKAVQKIYEIKQRPAEKSMIVLVSDTEMLKKYASDVPENFSETLEKQDGPTTYVFKATDRVAPELVKDDGTVGLRIVSEQADEFCHRLIKQLDRGLVSTSANLSGQQTDGSYSQVPDDILQKVDYVVTWRQDEETKGKPSRIVQLQPDGSAKVIRE